MNPNPIRLQMLMRPPVVFTQYDPACILASSDYSSALHQSGCDADALTWLWISYSRLVLEDVYPCMEANEGAVETIACTSGYSCLSHLEVNHICDKNYELKLDGKSLYLSETDAGEVYLYFFSPGRESNRKEDCRIDLTDFSSDASAYFIATAFGSYNLVAGYYEMKKNKENERSDRFIAGV